MIFEMTRDYDIVMPMILAVAISYRRPPRAVAREHLHDEAWRAAATPCRRRCRPTPTWSGASLISRSIAARSCRRISPSASECRGGPPSAARGPRRGRRSDRRVYRPERPPPADWQRTAAIAAGRCRPPGLRDHPERRDLDRPAHPHGVGARFRGRGRRAVTRLRRGSQDFGRGARDPGGMAEALATGLELFGD